MATQDHFITRLRFGIALTALLASLTVAAESELPPPSVAVAPNRIEMEVGDRPVTESITVMNLGEEPVTIETQVVNWDLDEANEFRQLPGSDGTLPAAIMLNPARFTIAEGGSQTVRFMVMPERLRQNGEHRAMIFFSKTVGTNQPGVQIRFRLGVPVYAAVGEVSRDMELHDLALNSESDRLRLAMDISATGNAYVRPNGYYLMWPATDFPGERKALKQTARMVKDPNRALPKGAQGGQIQGVPVLPGARREVASALQPPEQSGEFKVAVVMDAGSQRVERVLALSY